MTQSKVALSVIRGGFDHIKRHELMRELQWEFAYIAQQISLVSIDKELHEAYEAQRNGKIHFVTQVEFQNRQLKYILSTLLVPHFLM